MKSTFASGFLFLCFSGVYAGFPPQDLTVGKAQPLEGVDRECFCTIGLLPFGDSVLNIPVLDDKGALYACYAQVSIRGVAQTESEECLVQFGLPENVLLGMLSQEKKYAMVDFFKIAAALAVYRHFVKDDVLMEARAKTFMFADHVHSEAMDQKVKDVIDGFKWYCAQHGLSPLYSLHDWANLFAFCMDTTGATTKLLNPRLLEALDLFAGCGNETLYRNVYLMFVYQTYPVFMNKVRRYEQSVEKFGVGGTDAHKQLQAPEIEEIFSFIFNRQHACIAVRDTFIQSLWDMLVAHGICKGVLGCEKRKFGAIGSNEFRPLVKPKHNGYVRPGTCV